ncbi:hypothetical protein LPJ61_006451, partial [Coemansia biformis]
MRGTTVDLLSPEILTRVLQYAAGSSCYSVDEWRDQQLPLLSVCRRWRALISSQVLSQLYISLEERGPAAARRSCSSSGTDADGGIEDDMRIVSNLGVATSHGRHADIKALDIKTEDPRDITSFFERVAQMLGARALSWKSIETLRVSFLLDELAIGTDSSSAKHADMDGKTVQVCEGLVHLMPNISRIEIMGTSKCSESAMVMGRLVDMYAQQLRHLDTSLPLPLMSAQFSDRLVHLGMELDEGVEMQFPFVCAPSLQYLSLGNATESAIWHSFYGSTGSRGVTFSSLKRLCINFAADSERLSGDADERFPLDTLNFPELETLTVDMCPAASELLARASFPDLLKTLRVVGPLAGSMTLTNVAFGATSRKSICKHIAAGTSDGDDGLCTPNFFLGPSPIAGHASLHIGSTARLPANVAVTWPSLAELQIDAK